MGAMAGKWAARWLMALCAATLIFEVPAAGQTVMAPAQDGATLRARLAPVLDPPGRAMPVDAAALDAMIQRHAFLALGDRLMGGKDMTTIDHDLNWMQARLFQGGGFFVGFAYMRALWQLAGAMPEAQSAGLKQNAAAIYLYDLGLTAVDGPRCADPSAPEHCRDQLLQTDRAILDYLRGLPLADRMRIGTIAVSIEAATASVRGDDYVLCSGGLDQIAAGLKANGKKSLPQVPGAPGRVGKTYAVPPPPDYTPRFVPVAVAAPKQAVARRELPVMLTRLLAPAAP